MIIKTRQYSGWVGGSWQYELDPAPEALAEKFRSLIKRERWKREPGKVVFDGPTYTLWIQDGDETFELRSSLMSSDDWIEAVNEATTREFFVPQPPAEPSREGPIVFPRFKNLEERLSLTKGRRR